MSRSGYNDDYDGDIWGFIRWRGVIASASQGKRGQAFFKELLAALDALPEKRLIEGALELDGSYCALGALGHARGIDMSALDPDEPKQIGAAFNIAPQLAQETVYINDEASSWLHRTDEERWSFVRAWVVKNIKEPANEHT